MPNIPNVLTGRWIASATLAFLCCLMLEAAPVIPGVDRLADSDNVLAGEILLGELACTQCHQAEANQSRIWQKTAPDLSQVGARITPQYLTQFLTNPHSAKSGTAMPNIFHSSEAGARDGAVEYLTQFLVSLGGPIAPSTSGGNAKSIEWGKELFHSVGCVACHGPQDGTDNAGFKPLGNLAMKTTVDALTTFLQNPHETRRSGRMPSLWLNEDEARAISVFLLREQLKNPQSKTAPPAALPGLNVDYYETAANKDYPNLSNLTPKTRGTVDRITLDMPFKRRANNFTLRFSGHLKIEEAGEYTFATQSDDGSWLLIDDQLVVDNGGTHGMEFKSGQLNLGTGTHKFELVYFNGGGGQGLRVFWRKEGSGGRGGVIPNNLFTRSGGDPMVPLKTSPFTVNENDAQVGKRMFQAMRCASCHDLEGAPAISTSKPLVQLDVNSADGCLSTAIRKGLPDYQLSETQRQQVKAALAQRSTFNQSEPPARQVQKTLATFNCYACHERDGIGGPTDVIAANYFESFGDIDLGEEGKIPPTLNHVGAKLKQTSIASILGSQSLHVRHYMKTRMPNFGAENLTAFTDHIGQADQHPSPEPNPPFSEEAAEIGRKFVGTTGLACITCHKIAGQDALAIQGIDLSTVFDRINPSWFEAFLLNPAQFNKDTRMPQFWPDGESFFKDILGGDTKQQMHAIWAYLSLKNSLPIPEGIKRPGDVAMELTPEEAPIVHRTFMEDVGPRAILTGFPEKLSTAFDANVIRLAKVWRGRFFDHSGVESGRTDKFLTPLGEDVLDLPPGPSFAFLSTKESDWPTVEKTSRDIGGRFLGYKLGSDRRPTFRYRLGEATIEEKPEPLLKPGGATLKRSFNIKNSGDSTLYFLLGQGTAVTPQSDSKYTIDGSTVQIVGAPASVQPFIRTSNGQNQIIVPLTGNSVTFTQTIEW